MAVNHHRAGFESSTGSKSYGTIFGMSDTHYHLLPDNSITSQVTPSGTSVYNQHCPSYYYQYYLGDTITEVYDYDEYGRVTRKTVTRKTPPYTPYPWPFQPHNMYNSNLLATKENVTRWNAPAI